MHDDRFSAIFRVEQYSRVLRVNSYYKAASVTNFLFRHKTVLKQEEESRFIVF